MEPKIGTPIIVRCDPAIRAARLAEDQRLETLRKEKEAKKLAFNMKYNPVFKFRAWKLARHMRDIEAKNALCSDMIEEARKQYEAWKVEQKLKASQNLEEIAREDFNGFYHKPPQF